jgi:hypothetical protein
MPSQITIDAVTPGDIPLVMDLIRALAEYEHELDQAQATPEQLHEALFGPTPSAEAVIARLEVVTYETAGLPLTPEMRRLRAEWLASRAID